MIDRQQSSDIIEQKGRRPQRLGETHQQFTTAKEKVVVPASRNMINGQVVVSAWVAIAHSK